MTDLDSTIVGVLATDVLTLLKYGKHVIQAVITVLIDYK